MKGMTMPTGDGGMTMPAQPAPTEPSAMPTDHSQMSHMEMGHSGHHMAMTGAFGSYPMERESSGTAWQPDMSEHKGIHVMSGDWTFLLHGGINFVYDWQEGPRGNQKAFLGGHFLGIARHPLGGGVLQFRTILSPEPLMGRRGFPELLASGETANGVDRLIDRQHPHDFIGELSGSYSLPLSERSSIFVYGGLPGEPAFGPPAYLHRESIMDSPEAPITHHWLDSTHVSFGVVTAGLIFDRVKVEASRFNGREPDQHRWNIETGPLDSTAARLSWNPTPELALQASWAHLVHPEQLEPGVNQTRWSASVLYTRELAPNWRFAGTLAWGRRIAEHHTDDALAAEATVKHDLWTLFARGESVENRELVQGQDEPAYRVGKLSLGVIRDFQIADHLALGAGGLFSVNFVPDGLSPLYRGHNPAGAMGFVRLKLD
jgi:hypothetical protein